MRVSINEIKERSVRIFKMAGLSEEDASIITDVLLETEMRGVVTHGFLRLERYCNCIKSGGIKTDGNYKIDFDSPSWAKIDGNDNLGIVISYKAMRLAMKKAKETGIGIVNVKGSHHFGAAGYYTSMCAGEDMAGFAMSNGDILVAATGSAEKTIGNNPFSYAFPSEKYGSVVYDIAMSHTSDQKVIQFEKEGKELPPGWIIDKNGLPTQDASEYMKGGTLLPFGGYKGYGLAMMVEIFAAILSGSSLTRDVHAWNTDPNHGGGVGHLFVCLDISKTGDVSEYKKNLDNVIDTIKASKLAIGSEKIYYPGEIEANKLKKCQNDGFIDILDSTYESVLRAEKTLLGTRENNT